MTEKIKDLDCEQTSWPHGSKLLESYNYRLDNRMRSVDKFFLKAAENGYLWHIKAALSGTLLKTSERANINAQGSGGETALMLATELGHIDCVKTLLSSGADVNVANEFGFTALIVAAVNNRVDCLNALIEAGADLDAADVTSVTAITLSARCNYKNCFKSLVVAGADVNCLKEKFPDAYRAAKMITEHTLMTKNIDSSKPDDQDSLGL